MFDKQAIFTVPIFSGRKKIFRLRWPTDSEWSERARKVRIRRPLQSGREAETNDGEVDAELLGKLLVGEEQPEFDGVEASAVIGRLLAARLLDAELGVDRACIELMCAERRVVHHLLLPTRAQQEDARKKAVLVSPVGRRAEDIRAPLEPNANLYDSLFLSVEGYAVPDGTLPLAAVPIVHKDMAIDALFGAIRLAEEEPDPEG